MIPSIYINLEDDVSRIAARLKREKAQSVVLVCPKRCFLFNDSINLKLLKKQIDLLGKEVFILTMDERGQMYAQDAGFQLKTLPKSSRSQQFSDVRIQKPVQAEAVAPFEKADEKIGKQDAKIEESDETSEEIIDQPVLNTEQVENSRIITPSVSVADTVFPKEIEEKHQLTRKIKSNQKKITAFVAGSLIIILIVVFVVLPKATVVIFPKTEPLTRDLEISTSTNIKQADSSKLLLPATKITEVVEVKDKFQSQGKREVGNKASGSVYIYNLTKTPINLKVGTTVLTVGNKNYNLVTDVSGLKPAVYKDPKTNEIDESSLGSPVNVVASQGGESYNLPAGVRVEITNQVFGSRPQVLFAKTAAPVTGGTSRFLSIVSDQDIAASKATLTAKAMETLGEKLKAQNLTLPEKSYNFEVLEFTADKAVGTETPNFEASLKAKVTGLAINPEELKKLVYERIEQTLSNNRDQTVSPNSELSFKLKNPVDLTTELGILAAHFQGSAVYNVNVKDIASSLVGKSQNQVSEILKSKAEIEKIEITLAPSWQKTFPWFAGKIDVLIGK